MKHGYLGLLVVIALSSIDVQHVAAQSLGAEYAQLQARRVELEKRAEELSKTLRDLEQKTPQLEQTWLTCANGRWQLLWQSTISRSNDARKELESQRTRLFALNKQLGDRNFDLEQQRRNLENKFPTKSFQYETAFRQYTHSLQSDYLDRLDNEYFHSLDKYLSGIKVYQAFISEAAQACNNNDVAPQTLELGLSHVKDLFDIVKALKDILKLV